MSTTANIHSQLAHLHATYNSMYDQADAQLRKRPVLSAALYLKDVVRMGVSSLGGAALCVPAFWFWGAVSDLGSIQKVMVAPIDSAAVWANAQSCLILLFLIQMGLLVFRGGVGRSRDTPQHADTQQHISLAVAQRSTPDQPHELGCPHCRCKHPSA
jgi:hypothetical protein